MGDYTLPKNVTVVLAITLVHMNPEVWPDPNKFDPDRFLPENSKDRNPYLHSIQRRTKRLYWSEICFIKKKIMLTAILRK